MTQVGFVMYLPLAGLLMAFRLHHLTGVLLGCQYGVRIERVIHGGGIPQRNELLKTQTMAPLEPLLVTTGEPGWQCLNALPQVRKPDVEQIWSN